MSFCCLEGNDKVNGLRTNDTLKGGKGNDRITDNQSLDKLLGLGRKDRLNAGGNHRGDVLKGADTRAEDRRDQTRSC